MRILLVLLIYKGKGTSHPITGQQGPRGGVEVYLYSFSISVLGGGGWSVPRPGRFTPGKDPVSIVQEAAWAPGQVWTCAKNLAPTGSCSYICILILFYLLSFGFQSDLLPSGLPQPISCMHVS
jgi:hypothetical protein